MTEPRKKNQEPHDLLARKAKDIFAMPVGEDYTNFREMMLWETSDTMQEMQIPERRAIYGRHDALERAKDFFDALTLVARGEKNLDKALRPEGPTIRNLILESDVVIGMFLNAEGQMGKQVKGMAKGSDIVMTREHLGAYDGHDAAKLVRANVIAIKESTRGATHDLLEIQGQLQHLISILPSQQRLA